MSTNSQTPKTMRGRAEEKHPSRLEPVREQVEGGSLVIGQMTDEERRQYPLPHPAQAATSVVSYARA